MQLTGSGNFQLEERYQIGKEFSDQDGQSQTASARYRLLRHTNWSNWLKLAEN